MRDGARAYSVQRRYREFAALRSAVRPAIAAAVERGATSGRPDARLLSPLALFPGKKVASLSAGALEARRAQLDAFVRALARFPLAADAEARFRAFIAPDDADDADATTTMTNSAATADALDDERRRQATTEER